LSRVAAERCAEILPRQMVVLQRIEPAAQSKATLVR
jgi:hypothetical protein